MNTSLKEIIRECVMRNITVVIQPQPLSIDGMQYVVSGFAKSGKADVYETKEGVIEVHLRYNTVETIKEFSDLMNICYGWCRNYVDRGYGYDQWINTFIEYGLIKEVVETKTTYQPT